jgi:hypothetical protein
MKNSLCLGVLAVTCLGLGTANAQPPAMLPPAGTAATAPMPSVPFAAPAAQGMPPSQPGISEYLAYPRPTGSTGVGGDGFIAGEVYLRSGITFNLGGTGVFGRIYEPGFEIQGGVRSVFFQPDPTVGWTIDLGLSTTWYHNRRDEITVLRNVPSTSSILGQNITTILPSLPVTPTNLNQTAFRLALGQEYYLFGDADPADGYLKWRAGWDAGGTLGTEKLNFDEIGHRTGMTYGGLLAIHSDVEMPYGQCIFQAGCRAEYRYTGSNILQSQNNSDLSTLGFMFSAGVRY